MAINKTTRTNKIDKTKVFRTGSKLTRIQRKYCSCLMKVRTDLIKQKKIFTPNRKPQNKKSKKKMDDKAHYGICYTNIRKYQKMDKNKKLRRQFYMKLNPPKTNCVMNYNFDNYTLEEVQGLATENNVSLKYVREGETKYYKKSTLVSKIIDIYLKKQKEKSKQMRKIQTNEKN